MRNLNISQYISKLPLKIYGYGVCILPTFDLLNYPVLKVNTLPETNPAKAPLKEWRAPISEISSSEPTMKFSGAFAATYSAISEHEIKD